MNCSTKKYASITIISLFVVAGLWMYVRWESCAAMSVNVGRGITHIYTLEGQDSFGPDVVTRKVNILEYRFSGMEITIKTNDEIIIVPRSQINYIRK